MTYRLGRLPASLPASLRQLETYSTGPLPKPPATREVPQGPYPIDGNDRYGDCVMAGVAHCIAAWNREVGQKDTVPSSQTVISEYLKLSPADQGLSESKVLHEWYSKGFFGHKIAGYAPVSTTSLLQWHQAIAFYGACFLGIECPESAQEQFSKNEQWTYEEGSPILGGHAVVALGYGSHGGLHCATWGGIAVLSPAFLSHFLQEAWVVLPNQLVEAKKDALGIDLESLKADLARV